LTFLFIASEKVFSRWEQRRTLALNSFRTCCCCTPRPRGSQIMKLVLGRILEATIHVFAAQGFCHFSVSVLFTVRCRGADGRDGFRNDQWLAARSHLPVRQHVVSHVRFWADSSYGQWV